MSLPTHGSADAPPEPRPPDPSPNPRSPSPRDVSPDRSTGQPSGRCVLGLDVGGSFLKGAVLDAAYDVRYARSFPTGAEEGPDAVQDRIAEALAALAAQASGLGLDAPEAAGVVIPGIVDEARGVAVTAANIGWRDVPLRALLRDRLGVPVALGHDVRAGGLAEAVLGAAAGARNALVLPIGTGIAACCVVDGRPLVADGYAGEIGHVVVDPEGEPCPCGQRGCLERVASASAIARRYTARSGERVDGASEVAERLRAGDAMAQEVWDEAVDALARVLHTAVTLLGPEVVVVGGGLAEAKDLLLVPLTERLHARLTFQRAPRVVRAALGDQAGCRGAGILAWRALEDAEGGDQHHGGDHESHDRSKGAR